MQNLESQQKLLRENQMIYQQFLDKANLRLKKGESNRSEVSTATIQLKSIENQIKLVQAEIENQARQLQYLTNSKVKIYSNSEVIDWSVIQNIQVSSAHPILKLAEESIKTSSLETEVEKSKKAPVLSVGYSNQSFSDLDKNRYNSFQVGLQLPLFNRGVNSSIEASKVKVDMAKQDYVIQQAKLIQKFEILNNKVSAYNEVVEDFETVQIPASEDLQKTINRQLLEGEINFLDWVILNNQIIEVKTKYLEAKNLREQTYVLMSYYTID